MSLRLCDGMDLDISYSYSLSRLQAPFGKELASLSIRALYFFASFSRSFEILLGCIPTVLKDPRSKPLRIDIVSASISSSSCKELVVTGPLARLLDNSSRR